MPADAAYIDRLDFIAHRLAILDVDGSPLAQYRLAAMLGVTRTTVSDWETPNAAYQRPVPREYWLKLYVLIGLMPWRVGRREPGVLLEQRPFTLASPATCAASWCDCRRYACVACNALVVESGDAINERLAHACLALVLMSSACFEQLRRKLIAA